MNEWEYRIKEESYLFALMVISCCRYIAKMEKEFILTNQLFKSWTSIGANIREAQEGQSKKDFLHKMSISLKEARESKYWISLLKDSWYFYNYPDRELLIKKSNEMIWVLTKIVKTTKLNLKKKV